MNTHYKTRWQKYKIAYLPLGTMATPQEKEVKNGEPLKTWES
jgi:hypothetical protein